MKSSIIKTHKPFQRFINIFLIVFFWPFAVISSDFETSEYAENYGLSNINAADAYEKGFSGAGVTIGIVDSGIAEGHSEFKDKYSFGYDYVDNTSVASDPNGHGSHVAGIAAAAKDGIGMHGVAYGANVANGRGLNAAGSGYFSDLGSSINYLALLGARVVNNSWQTSTSITSSSVNTWNNTRQSFMTSLNSALEEDSLIVFAAGNFSRSEVSSVSGLPYLFPEMEAKWLTVVSSTSSNILSSFSNSCGVASDFCLTAPGSSIKSVKNTGGYSIKSGTSMAAPMVSGVAALVMEAFPYMTVEQIRTIMLTTAIDLGDPGVDSVYGWGLINAAGAVGGINILGPVRLEINDEVNSTWSNNITGSGGFTKNGTGVLTLSGENTYTGDTAINAGTLVLNGSIKSQLSVGSVGTLSGKGLIEGNVQMSGTLSPGESPGILTISGALTLGADSRTIMDIDGTNIGDGAGGHDRINLTGSEGVLTAGGIMQPILRGISGDANNNFTPIIGQSFPIISAAGGISDSFASLTQPSEGLVTNSRFDLLYGVTNIDLVTTPASYKTSITNMLSQPDILSNLAGAIDNARSSAGVRLTGRNKTFFDAFYPLNASEVSDAIVSLSGTVQSSLLVENIDLQHDLVKQINDQSRSAHNIFSASVSRNYWQIGSGSFGEHESDAKGFGHDFNRYMALGGINFNINQNVTLGFGGGYADSRITEHAQKRKGSLESYFGFIKASATYKNLSGGATIGVSFGDHQASRLITFGTNTLVRGKSDNRDVFAGFDLSLNHQINKVTLEPTVAFSMVALSRDAFNESGEHPGTISFSKHNHVAMRGRLSLPIKSVFTIKRKNDLILDAELGWSHELSADSIRPEAMILSQKFHANGVNPMKNLFQISTQMNFYPSTASRIILGYRGEFAGGYKSHGFKVSANINF